MYGATIAEGNDERLYVQAIYEANKGRPGIYLTDVHLDLSDSIGRDEAELETLRVFRGVRVTADHTLWVPSDAFVQILKQTGKITSGSTGLRAAWSAAKTALAAVVDNLEVMSGLGVGLFDGAGRAVVDIFAGLPDAVRVGIDAMEQLLPGEILLRAYHAAGAIIDFFKSTELSDVSRLASAVGDDVAGLWTGSSWFERGELIGKVVGYVAMNVVLAIASGGTTEAMLARKVAAGSDLARLVQLFLKAVKVAQDPFGELAAGVKAKGLGAAGEALRDNLAAVDEARAAEDAEAATAKAKTDAERLARFERELPPDLRGRLVANDELGSGVRVSYKDGVRIEVGADADAVTVAAHVKTARFLLRFEGPLGSVNKLLNAIGARLGLVRKYGTRGFEAELEIAKLTELKGQLETLRGELEQSIARVGGEADVGKEELDKLERQIQDAEAQIEEHEAALDSTEAGRGYVDSADPQVFIKSIVGERSKSALRKYVFEAGEEADVLMGVKKAAQSAGEAEYQKALQDGLAADKARDRANRAIAKAAEVEATAEAIAAAQRRADRAVADGSVFKMDELGPEARAQLERFRNGEIGADARRIADELVGMSDKEFLDLMDREVASNKGITKVEVMRPGPAGGPAQPMTIWEYPDGTTIRRKPLGDDFQQRPTVSIEMKREPSRPDNGPADAAFKVNEKGQAVPVNDKQIASPYSRSTNDTQAEAFENWILGAAHFRLR